MPARPPSPTSRTLKLFGAGARTLGRVVLQKLTPGDDADSQARHWGAVGADWVRTLASLRGAAMKLGQLASQYGDLLPPALADQLRLLQRAAVPVPLADLQALIDTQWSAAQRAQVARIEPVALAAASIGQVHRATLADGRAVVVKIRYPGVKEAVDADLVQLRRLITLSKLLPLDDAAMDRLMDEVRARFAEETDYSRELEHLQAMHQYASLPGIVYATPETALCTDGLIVMSEEPGEPLERARLALPALREQWALHLCQWFVHSLFFARAVHADPHAGNFAFRSDGRVVVYDMGCVKRVPAATVAQVARMLRAALAQDWSGVHDCLRALDGVDPAVDFDELQELYAEFGTLSLGRMVEHDTVDFGQPHFIDDLRAAGRRHIRYTFKFTPVSDLVFVMRELSGLYWLLRTLDARVPLRALILDTLHRYEQAAAA